MPLRTHSSARMLAFLPLFSSPPCWQNLELSRFTEVWVIGSEGIRGQEANVAGGRAGGQAALARGQDTQQPAHLRLRFVPTYSTFLC